MGQKLRVLSANLWDGRGDPKAFAELVAAMDVDIVAVQECGAEQAEALTQVMQYGSIEPSGCHPGSSDYRGHSGMGIVLKRPSEVRIWELPHRSAYCANLTPEAWPELARPVEVINVHFAAPQVQRPRLGFTVRGPQMREFQRQLAQTPQPPQRIVVGDFNATPLWPLYRRMSAQFTDAAVAVARQAGRRTQRTWGPGSGAPRLLRIDHGFVTKGMRVDEFQVVPVRGSDHSAIVMDVLLD